MQRPQESWEPASALWPLLMHVALACANGLSLRVLACGFVHLGETGAGQGLGAPLPLSTPAPGPRTSWSRKSEEVFVTSPDETVTNGLARPGGHQAGRIRQMFVMRRKPRQVEAGSPRLRTHDQRVQDEAPCAGGVGSKDGWTRFRPPICFPLMTQPCPVIVVVVLKSTKKSFFFLH